MAKSEALFNICNFLREDIKSSNIKDRVKITRTLKNNNSRSNYHKNKFAVVQHAFLYYSLLLFSVFCMTNVKLLLITPYKLF